MKITRFSDYVELAEARLNIVWALTVKKKRKKVGLNVRL